MIDRSGDSYELMDAAGRSGRALYRKPQLRLHGTLKPQLLGSPPPPPGSPGSSPTGGLFLGIRNFPWK